MPTLPYAGRPGSDMRTDVRVPGEDVGTVGRRGRLIAGAIIVFAIAWSGAIAFDLVPALRGPSEWRWPFYARLGLVPWRLLAPALVAGLIGWWAWRARRRDRVSVAGLLALVALAAGFRLAVQFIAPTGVDVVGRTMNPAYMSAFASAAKVADLDAALSTYVRRNAELGVREKDHPPGNTVFFWACIQLARHAPGLAAAAHPFIAPRRAAMEPWFRAYPDADIVAGGIAGMAVLLLGCAAIIPLYHLARRLDGPRTAWLAVVGFAVMPAGTLFMPVVDDLQTPCVATGALLVVLGLTRPSLWAVAVGGAAVGLGTFLSYSVLPAGFFLGLVIVLAALTGAESRPWSRLAGRLLAFGGGVGLVWVVYWVGWGVDPVELLLASLPNNFSATLRSYWAWLVGDPYDLMLFAGAPAAALTIAAVVRAARGALHRARPALGDVVTHALVVAGAVLFASGKLRGEAARTLLYVFPFLAWVAAREAERLGLGAGRVPAVLGAVTVVQTVLLQALLRVYH